MIALLQINFKNNFAMHEKNAILYRKTFCIEKKNKRKNWSHFDLKTWVTGKTKILPGIPSNCQV